MPSLPELIERYRKKGVLVDSSLLVVYLVGAFDRRHLINCRAIKSSFSVPEFDLLVKLIGSFDMIVTTPHVLTEVSNLAGRLPENIHIPFRSFFAAVIANLQERGVAASNLATAKHFVRFGIADTAITMIAPGEYLVLTEEAALFGYLSKQGIDVLNFNHIRVTV